MSTAFLIVASGVSVARACGGFYNPEGMQEITQCGMEMMSHPAMKAWTENMVAEQSSKGGQVTYAYTWHCTSAMMPPVNQYGVCLCDYMTKLADRIDSTCQEFSEYDLRAIFSESVSNIMALYCPGLNFDCNGAAPTFTMYSFQFIWTMEVATGTLVSYEAEIKYAVATSAGVHERQVRISFGGSRRLSGSSSSAGHTVTATIDDIPTESAAAKVQSRAQASLKAELETAVPGASVSTVEVSSLTKVNVSVQEAFGRGIFADSAHCRSLCMALLLSAAVACFFADF